MILSFFPNNVIIPYFLENEQIALADMDENGTVGTHIFPIVCKTDCSLGRHVGGRGILFLGRDGKQMVGGWSKLSSLDTARTTDTRKRDGKRALRLRLAGFELG